jgi:hypothetical protein
MCSTSGALVIRIPSQVTLTERRRHSTVRGPSERAAAYPTDAKALSFPLARQSRALLSIEAPKTPSATRHTSMATVRATATLVAGSDFAFGGTSHAPIGSTAPALRIFTHARERIEPSASVALPENLAVDRLFDGSRAVAHQP